MLYLTEEDVTRLLTMPLAMDAVEDGFRQLGSGGGDNLPRRRLHARGAAMHLMAAALPNEGFLGFKVYTVKKGNARFWLQLFNADGGEMVAMLEANRLGQMRTGAASGVATRWMAREGAQRVGVIGSGWQARTQLEAVLLARPATGALVYSRNPEKLERFCAGIQDELGVGCRPAKSSNEVVEAADILITMTSSVTPVVEGARLRPGTHINAAGSNSILKRELDETAIVRSSVIVVDSKEQARLECGEFLAPLEKGLIHWPGIRELTDVVRDGVSPRKAPQDITLFKSLGLAMEDVIVGARLYAMAREQGAGKQLEL